MASFTCVINTDKRGWNFRLTCIRWLQSLSGRQTPVGKELKETVSKHIDDAFRRVLCEKLDDADKATLHGVPILWEGMDHDAKSRTLSTLQIILCSPSFARAVEADAAYALKLCGGADNLFKKKVG